MFKKSNRNFRAKRNDSDEDENSNSNEVTVKSKPAAALFVDNETKKVPIKNTTLSFDLEAEAEDGEAFKIKKSKESRRMTKEKKKERRNPSETKKPKDNSGNEDDVILFNEEVKLKPLTSQGNTKLDEGLRNLTFKSDDKFRSKKSIDEIEIVDSDEENEEEKIRQLREEIEIINGDQDENETDEQKRSMKILLKTGHIPDSNMIHEARKKREMARKGDYMPINMKNVELKGPKSRLIREDENDIDEDDECYSFDILEKSNKEKQQTRENFLAYEQGSDSDEGFDKKDDDEEEEEEDEWEKEQIRKGVGLTQILNLKKSNNIDASVLEKYVGYTLEPESMDVEVKHEIQMSNLPKVTFESIKEKLRANTSSFDETYRAHLNERSMAQLNLNLSKSDVEKLRKERPMLNDQYTFYQGMRSFVADIIDCYSEKLEEIEKMELKWIKLMKDRASKISSRRQEDINDQNAEYSLSNKEAEFGKTSFEPSHQRRMADRDSRRLRRKQNRDSNIEHYDGLSSDDDDNFTIFNQKRNDIIGRGAELFNDVHEDFHNIDLIKMKFEEWRSKYPNSYEDAYASLSLPKLFSPLVRLEMIDWNPLETGINDFLNKKWLQSLKTFHNSSVNEDDKLLVARIVEKTIFSRIIELVENVYDPFSTKQTKNLTSLIKLILNEYPSLNVESNANTKKLLDSVDVRIRKTYDNDVFVPLFPKIVIDNKANSSSVFFYRQFWSCVKLLVNVIDWNGILTIKTVQELSLNSLLNRYIIVALQYMPLNMETLLKIEWMTSKFPKNWFQNLANSQTIPQLKNICDLLMRIVDNFESDLNKNNSDAKLFKENVRYVRKLFVSIQAMDLAIELTNKFQIK